MQRERKGQDATDWKAVMEGLGESMLRIRGNWIHLKDIDPKFLTKKLNKGLIKISKKELILSEEKFILSLATKRYAGKNLFEKNPDAVLLAWAKSQEIRDYNKKRAIETNLKRYPTVRAKIEAAKNPCLTVRYVGGLKLKELLAVARNIVKEVPLHGEIRNALCNKARVVTSNDRSIEDLLTNNKRIAKHFFFSCTPWCKQGKHFSKNMSDIEGLCSKIGALNAKFIPADRKEWTKKNIIFSLLDWSNRLISIKTGRDTLEPQGIMSSEMKIQVKD